MLLTGYRKLVTAGLAVASLIGASLLLPTPMASAAATVELHGHGYGHGRGMGQYGALGYALDAGWGAERITDHYYGGTTLGYQPNRSYSIRLTALDGRSRLSFTSTSGFSVGSLYVGPGVGAIMQRNGNGWQLFTQYNACDGDGRLYGPWMFGDGTVISPTGLQGRAPSDLLTVCETGVGYRGSLALPLESGATRVVNITTMEDYLRGVVPQESPPSWGDLGNGLGMQALYAQAIAARSYGYSEHRYSYADTCDTTSCQVYGGAAYFGGWREDARTNNAVSTTAGLVRLFPSGAIARTEFSSSSGGYTAGGTFPAVPDAGDSQSPYQNWTTSLSGSAISARYGIGDFHRLQVTARNGLGADGGRVTAMQVVGSARTVTVTGDQFRSDWGLRSNWFTPVGTTQTVWVLRNSPSAGASDAAFPFGGPQDLTLACDFNGDGGDELVAFRDGYWSVRVRVSPGPADYGFAFGGPAMKPICGDWDGNGRDGIGVFDQNGVFHLRNAPSTGPADNWFAYGWGAAAPLVGDFGGSGGDGIGIYDSERGTWLLRTSPTPGPAEIMFSYGGWPGADPVIGDWDGVGTDGIGIYSAGTWMLRNSPTAGAPELQFDYGSADYAAVVGNWDAVGGDGIGVTRRE